jgi:hypothetical protein
MQLLDGERGTSMTADREFVRGTAARLIRDEDVSDDDVAIAGALVDTGAIPRIFDLQCIGCGEACLVYADEQDARFLERANGWRCAKCGAEAAARTIQF